MTWFSGRPDFGGLDAGLQRGQGAKPKRGKPSTKPAAGPRVDPPRRAGVADAAEREALQHVEWVSVEQSSNVAAVGYRPLTETAGTLYVRYTTGAVYTYRDVPRATFDALLAAPSVGTYLAREVKPRYDCALV